MPDNMPVTPGTGTTLPVATDEIAGVHWQRIKLAWGGDGQANEADIATGKPLPIQLRTPTGGALDTNTGPATGNTQRVTVDIDQLAPQQNAQQPFSQGAQGVYIPSDHPPLPVTMTGATVIAAPNSSAVYSGATSMTPKWKIIAASTLGTNEIVPLVTSKKIRVLSWDLSPSAAVNAKWQSAAIDKTGLYYMAGIGNGQARNFNHVGWFETNAGEALNLNLNAAVPVGGVIAYVEV